MLANLVWAFLLQDQSGGVSWNIIDMWHSMGWPARTVVIILFIMSAWSVGIMIDRWLM